MIEFSCKYQEQNICRFLRTACKKTECQAYYGKCAFCNRSCHTESGSCSLEPITIYAVKSGRNPGIYINYKDFRLQVEGYYKAKYQIFHDRRLAELYIQNQLDTVPAKAELEKKKPVAVPYAYVDGSFNKANGTYGYGGFVFDGEKHILQGKGNEPEMASMRNVAGEILGATAAIQYAVDHGYKEIRIYYDYLGIEHWPTGKWTAGKQGTIQYRDFCRRCMTEHGLKILFEKVKAHSGVSGNEEADRLAKAAVGISA